VSRHRIVVGTRERIGAVWFNANRDFWHRRGTNGGLEIAATGPSWHRLGALTEDGIE
jgi:hypothetical protein